MGCSTSRSASVAAPGGGADASATAPAALPAVPPPPAGALPAGEGRRRDGGLRGGAIGAPPPLEPTQPARPQEYSRLWGWDPLAQLHGSKHGGSSDKPTRECVVRIARDVNAIYKDPLPGIVLYADEGRNDITLLHALLTGQPNTPYELGYFHFVLRCPPHFPISPPKVKLMTTGRDVRFNPNLYSTGKVCLSILGTWSGPSWSPALSLSSVLLSIQSLMHDKPLVNEPGYESKGATKLAIDYCNYLRHETIRVAVCDMLEDPWREVPLPEPLTRFMMTSFLKRYPHLRRSAVEHEHLDGQSFVTSQFHQIDMVFNFSGLVARLDAVYRRICAKLGKEPGQIPPAMPSTSARAPPAAAPDDGAPLPTSSSSTT